MTNIKKWLCLWILTYTSISLLGQQSLPYFCGFETDDECLGWELNAGATDNFTNLWCIGSAAYRSGLKSMYISYDNGTTAGYTANRNMLAASHEFQIPQGTYLLSFDWRSMGTADSTAILYVCWMPATIETSSILSSSPPDWVSQRKLTCSGETVLWGASSWKNEQVTLQTNGNPYKLVFVWLNATSNPVNPGACIDNVQLTTIACPPPEELQIEHNGTTTTFKWQGNANSYSLKYNIYGQNTWAEIQNITNTEYSVQNLENGVYSFWVQGNCDNDTSIWSESEYYLIYDISAVTSCINYIDLDNAQCWIGSTSNPYTIAQKVDHGFAAKESRHTIHYLPDEYDPRTDGLLKTVPEGALASVRLGNWDVNGEAEGIAYEYYVEPDMNGVLLLKYAVVLEKPTHDPPEQPRFKLEILKEDGSPVDEMCASADFTAGENLIADGWHTVGSNNDIIWKDWTTIGVNLLPYEGQTLTVRLTTYDCSPKAHYGYAYFTLDCADGAITGISCGGNPTERFKAPDGFYYRWYKTDDPDVTLGTSQEYPTPPGLLALGDTSLYSVDCIYPEAEQCFFTLTASAKRRDPVVSVSYELYPNQNCQNEVQFINNSYILMEGEPTDMKCEAMLWSFGDPSNTTSTSYAPSFIYPKEGGDFTVSVTAYISDNQCDSTISFNLHLPPVDNQNDTLYVSTCKDYYEFFGETLTSEGIYSKNFVTQAGCDSIVILDLHFVDMIEQIIYDTICEGENYIFGERILGETGEYMHTFITDEGCDSLVQLMLYVRPKGNVQWTDIPSYCGGIEGLPISYYADGVFETYYILYSDSAKKQGFIDLEATPLVQPISIDIPQGVRPGQYAALVIFGDPKCGNDTIPLEISVLYPDSIIVQRWDDMLSVTNDRWNGGYTFSSYQWYKNGQPMSGQTGSYLYVPEEKLDTESEYSVLLTRADDNVAVMTCPFVPQTISEDERTKLVISIDNLSYNSLEVEVAQPAQIKVYNTLGLKIYESSTENHAEVPLPTSSGMYIIEITGDNGQRETYRTIVK